MKFLNQNELKDFLDSRAAYYNNTDFIETDPISIPHRFSKKEDREISGFLTATIAWGQRVTIINNMTKLISWMDDSPHEFIVNCQERDLRRFSTFVHRTYNGQDCICFINTLKNIYQHYGGLEPFFMRGFRKSENDLSNAIHVFRNQFFSFPHLSRTEKHIADPLKNSTAKRMCMFLRWMVRKDKNGVDFGIWNHLGMQWLSCPLDIHSARVARKLGILKRTQNDWKAVCELTANLKRFDNNDPAKYDFALFGLGVNEKF